MNYVGNMQKAIKYIDGNFKEEINLSELSRQAYMSQSYFFKIFRIMTGYSVKEYIRTYRLNLASLDLIYSDKRIIDIAFEYGFNSQQTFTKAFSKYYGISPNAYRMNRKEQKPFKKITFDYQGGVDVEKCFEHVRIITKNEMITIGVETIIDYNVTGHSPIKELWDKWVSEELYKLIPNTLNSPETLGITLDETKEETAIYSICMEVSSLENIPEGMVGRKYSNANYAVFKTELRHIKSGEFWKFFYYNWLPNSGYEQPGSLLTQSGFQMTNQPQIELYRNYMSNENDEVEIYAPIVK